MAESIMIGRKDHEASCKGVNNLGFPHPDSDYFTSDHRPYYIASGEWMQTSMGYRSPFLLCHILNELGYEAYVTAQKQAPKLRTPLLTAEIIAKHKTDGRKTIAVYNEGVWGNVLRGDIVVRWMMNRLGRLAGQLPDSEDLFFYWDKAYAPNSEASRILRMPSADTSVFYHDGINNDEREGYAYYAHKYTRDGRGKISEEVKAGGISLCQDFPRSQQEIADILRRVKVLYVYEETALAEEAAFCGCPVVLIMNSYISSLYGNANPYDYVVWEDELDIGAHWDYSGKLLASTLNMNKRCECQLAKFILDTQNAIPGRVQTDEFSEFIHKYDDIYLYGAGITSTMVYNVLKAAGTRVCGFVVSDEFYSREKEERYGLPVMPISKLNAGHGEAGIVMAMMKTNVLQAAKTLDRMKTRYYNPVLL